MQLVPFLYSIPRGYKFRTIEVIMDENPKQRDIENRLKLVINRYHTQGLKVTQINTDNDFQCIRKEVRPENLNIMVAREHFVNIERSGRTIKEGIQ